MRKNILIINPFGIGDVLFSTVLVRQLRKDNPSSYIAYICNLKVKDVLATNPDINEVFVFERDEYRNEWKKSKVKGVKKFLGFWGEIKKKKFDVVFDLSLGKEYAFLCWWIGIKERKGFNYKKRGRFLTHKIEFDGFNDKPVAEYYLDLFCSRLATRCACGSLEQYSSSGVLSEAKDEVEKCETVLVTTEYDKEYIYNFLNQSGVKDSDILIGIAPGGGMSFGQKNQDRRRWGVKKFAELADKINAKVVLIWGPGEEGLVKEIASLMKQKPFIAPATKIREMAALCKRCKLVICSEGGPLHIANSQGVKTVSIFGPVDEKVYGPYPLGNNITVTSGADCRPCYKKFKLPECGHKKCLEDISVDWVLDSLCSLEQYSSSEARRAESRR
ncbi:MAG: glycosyltransferase family 9 protein [Candidatus Omnitrophota bacterium]|nr:glycosyltransferase family 9 protein [Candidatus Omnitrophota bacterium]